MTDSVWWYILAGFLLGFILSTLWEWLYFRRRRMQIENQRIAELEATVRSLSTVSQSAEASTSSAFAAGYQSPMVFLEGEEDDVDTVEVIVPAPAEPTDYERAVTVQTLSSEQQRAGAPFVAARAAAGNGNGLVSEAPSEAPKGGRAAVAAGSVETTQSTLSPAALAAGAAAATVWTQDRERTAGAPYPQEQAVTEPPAAVTAAGEEPVVETALAQMPATETIVYSVPADQAAAEQLAREQSPEEHIPGLVGDLSPSRQISAVSTAPDEEEHASTPAQPAAQLAAPPTPVDDRAGTLVPAAALVSAAALDERQTVRQQQPEEMVDQAQGPAAPQAAASSAMEVQPTAQGTEDATEGSKTEYAGPPAADTTVRVTSQPTTQTGDAHPVIAAAPPPPAVQGQSDRQKAEEDSGLTPAGVAVLASALASKLAGDQQRPPEASQQQALQPPASQVEPPAALPQAAASEPQAISDSAAATRVVPVVYDMPDTQSSTQPDAPGYAPGGTSTNISAGIAADKQGEQPTPAGAAMDVNPEQDHAQAMRAGSGAAAAEAQGTNPATPTHTGSAPSEVERVGPAAGLAIDPGEASQSLAPQEQEPVLPLSAILPRAAKPAPLSKSGQARRPDAAPANAVAASGIEPEIEQVSNQLDDLIDSINGLIERTQPLLEQPASQVAPAATPFTSTSPTALDVYSASIEDSVDTGLTGPYSAQNLSRMEYGLVQLMQAVRRLGRDVRSAF